MLDDDATVPTNFISQIIESPYIDEFDIIGGFFLPWYKYGRPKWYIDTWVSNVIPNFAGGPAPQGIYACAGIMAFKRDIWSDVKGFRIDLGHIGNKRLYGEETEFQIKAIQKGYKLAIDPKWTINHLVDQSKLKLIWQFSNGIKLGQAYQQVSSKAESTIRILSGLKHITLIYFPKIFISILLLKDPRTRLAFFLAETGFTSGVFLQRFFPFLL
jgi:GT2 family glycosyltransferase